MNKKYFIPAAIILIAVMAFLSHAITNGKMLHAPNLLLVLSVVKLPEILLDIIGQKLLVQNQKLV